MGGVERLARRRAQVHRCPALAASMLNSEGFIWSRLEQPPTAVDAVHEVFREGP